MNCPICMANAIENEMDACLDCVATGKRLGFFLTQPVRNNVLDRIRELPDVTSANLWPTAPAEFVLGITKTDRIFVAGTAIEAGIGGLVAYAPAIPTKDGQWALLSGFEFINEREELIGICASDDALIEAVKEA